MSPEVLLGFWANAGDVDKGVLKQVVFLLSLGNDIEGFYIKKRPAMTGKNISQR